MRFSKKLLAAPAAALALGAGLMTAAPAAYADDGQETFWGAAATESMAHQLALNDLAGYEQEYNQECHQVSYRVFRTPLEPSTRLSGLWQYFITAACHGTNIALDNLQEETIGLFPGGTMPVLRLVSEPEVQGDGVYFAYSTSQERTVRMITGMDIPRFSVEDWESVAIALPSAGETVEVRYGNLDSPQDAQVVGSARHTG
ncbi:hypothetical protein [Streptomyces sp. NPDC096030]|uniref:hypothetical protein n=1 Tax=Streptomyces sp. NPDC096030 TaxID=3155423 RepID=UPI0033214BCC